MIYRTKLRTVEALQFTGTNYREMAQFALHQPWLRMAIRSYTGDWLIKREDGSLRRCSAKKFAKRYEPEPSGPCTCGHDQSAHSLEPSGQREYCGTCPCYYYRGSS